MRVRTHIVVHHSFTEDGQTVSWGAIERYHREMMGWRDIGYHGGVELVGDPLKLGRYAYQGLVGRSVDDLAAAVKEANMNAVALHLCLVGNFDLAPPSEEILRVARNRFVLPWMRQFGILPENVRGHHDFAPYKSCPGLKFDMEAFRRSLA